MGGAKSAYMEELAAAEAHPKAIELLIDAGTITRCSSHEEFLIEDGSGIEEAYSAALHRMADEDEELAEFRDDPKALRVELQKAVDGAGDGCPICDKNMSD
jgi:hypothetical protein